MTNLEKENEGLILELKDKSSQMWIDFSKEMSHHKSKKVVSLQNAKTGGMELVHDGH